MNRRDEIRRKVQRIIFWRRVLRIIAWPLILLALYLFVIEQYGFAIAVGFAAVVLAILSDWIVKRPDELEGPPGGPQGGSSDRP